MFYKKIIKIFYYIFLIKFSKKRNEKIELGRAFFKEFTVIYNNGNETLNFFGDIKKLNVSLRELSNLFNTNFNGHMILCRKSPKEMKVVEIAKINTGILLLNLQKMRYTKFEKKNNKNYK